MFIKLFSFYYMAIHTPAGGGGKRLLHRTVPLSEEADTGARQVVPHVHDLLCINILCLYVWWQVFLHIPTPYILIDVCVCMCMYMYVYMCICVIILYVNILHGARQVVLHALLQAGAVLFLQECGPHHDPGVTLLCVIILQCIITLTSIIIFWYILLIFPYYYIVWTQVYHHSNGIFYIASIIIILYGPVDVRLHQCMVRENDVRLLDGV